jgi:hypothetical protein
MRDRGSHPQESFNIKWVMGKTPPKDQEVKVGTVCIRAAKSSLRSGSGKQLSPSRPGRNRLRIGFLSLQFTKAGRKHRPSIWDLGWKERWRNTGVIGLVMF